MLKKITKKTANYFTAITIIILLLLTTANPASAEGKNLLSNPGFENISSNAVKFWSNFSYNSSNGTSDSYQYKIDNQVKHSGNYSVMLENNLDDHSRFSQTIDVKPNTYYKFSGYVKTENVPANNKGAHIFIENLLVGSNDVTGTTNGWEYVEFYGKTGDKQDKLEVSVGLGGYGSLNTGKAWFDDFSVEEVSNLPEGITAQYLYDSVQTGNSISSLNIIGYIFAFLTLLTIILLFLITKKFRIKKVITADTDLDTNESEYIVPKPIKFSLDKRDFIIMSILTVIYSVIALFNLGDMYAPNTSWQSMQTGDSFVVDLGKDVQIDRINYYCGEYPDIYDNKNKFDLDFLDTDGTFKNLSTFSTEDKIYVWKTIKVDVKTSKLKITTESPGAALNEIAVFEKGSKEPIKGIKIEDINAGENSKSNVKNLIDEQDKVAYDATYLNGTYFDEIYHARAAQQMTIGMDPSERTHPPLGKILISVGILIFGMNPFGWRIIGTLFGIAMVPIMYIFGKKFFNDRFLAFCTSFLMAFDFMHYTQTRIATIDVYSTFFIILMYYFMYDYFMNKSYVLGFKVSIKKLFLCGLMFGIGVACKWISAYAGGGLALLFFLTKINEYHDYYRLVKKEKVEKIGWLKHYFPLYLNSTLLCCILFFIVIPAIIYFASYIPFLLTKYPVTHNFADIISNQSFMFNFHKNLTATHPFQSKPYEWPVMIKPMWYFSGEGLPADKVSTIVAMGNPAIWWIGIFAFFISVVAAVLKKDKKMTVIITAIVFQYLPWFFVTRALFIYHFFTVVPFMIICIVYCIKLLIDNSPIGKHIVYVYLGLVIIMFIAFYPIISGFVANRDYLEHLKWMSSWVLF